MSEQPNWEDVLAAVEADLERSRALLHAATPFDGRVDADTMAPVEMMMPAPVLPPLASMPPVPAAMGERIGALLASVTAVREQMTAAMADVAAQLTSTPGPTRPVFAAAVPAPRFLDRAL